MFMKSLFLLIAMLMLNALAYAQEDDLKLDEEWLNEEQKEDPLKKDNKDWKFKFTGFIRALTYGTDSVSQEQDSQLFMFQSYQLNLGALYVGSWLDSNIQVNQDFSFSNESGSLNERIVNPKSPRNRIIPDFYQVQKNGYAYRSALKKAFVKYHDNSLQIVAGRQAVSWGEGRFLNPMDLVTPVSPFSFDIDDIECADALNLHYFLNASDSIQLVAVPYHRENQKKLESLKSEDINFLIRPKGTIKNLDLTFISGRHFHSSLFGIETNITQWDASFRFSYLARREDKRLDHLTMPGIEIEKQAEWIHQWVAGGSYAFFHGKLKTTLEFFFNTGFIKNNVVKQGLLEREKLITLGYLNPSSDDETFFSASGRIWTKNFFLGELGLSYSLTEIVNIDCFMIGDPAGNSAFIHPGLGISLTDEAVLSLGANIYLYSVKNQSKAEFGSGKTEIVAHLKWYF